MKKLLRSIYVVAALALCLSASTATAAETVLTEADFSTLTKGSEDTPEMFKYSFDFTGFSGWSIVTGKTGQAGGSLYLADGGSIKSGYLSGVTTNGGAIKVSAVIKLRNASAGIVQLAWGYSSTQQIIVESSDWETVEFFVQPTSASSYSNQATISPLWLADGLFVKSIKIAQSPDFLAAPTANQPTNADGTSFTATWKAVTGATKYFIDVYSYNAAGDKVMFIENQECATTSCKVEGLDATTTYYFVVRAANETGVSGNSNEIEIVKYISKLDAPAVKIASCDEDRNFTASWESVADADSYTVTVFKEEALTEAGEANVLVENFNAFTSGSFTDVEYIYDRHLEVLNEPGWSGYNMACVAGAIGITPYGDEGYLITPALDLSDDEGKISIIINMASNNLGSFKTGDIVSFSTIDANDNESSPVNVTIDQLGFADYTVNLTGGTAATKIKISSDSNNKIFIDDFAVKQMKPAGFVNTTTYLQNNTEATSYTGKVEFARGVQYKLVVVAEGRTVSGGQISGISSAASEAVTISGTSGIGNVSDSAEAVTIAKTGRGVITVSTPAAVTVEIYDIAGRLIAAAPLAEGTTSLSVDATGIVIVKAGTTTAKIAL
ncbi:MAG: fibronectin type III domain-containing protein [Muribaculaceae bacterium]|nr:fibronectin type III domain-containing protein [Muribaculaceae bacterium]